MEMQHLLYLIILIPIISLSWKQLSKLGKYGVHARNINSYALNICNLPKTVTFTAFVTFPPIFVDMHLYVPLWEPLELSTSSFPSLMIKSSSSKSSGISHLTVGVGYPCVSQSKLNDLPFWTISDVGNTVTVGGTKKIRAILNSHCFPL